MSEMGVPHRFLDIAKATRAPRALSESGLSERFGPPDQVDVVLGQVWRARWTEVSVLVLVLAVEGRDVQAAPVTIDPPAEDDRSLVVDGSSTAFGVDATAWAGLVSAVPVRVLERLVDVWTEEQVRWVVSMARGEPQQAPLASRRGREIRSELDPVALFRAEIADDLELLRKAPALPVETPGAAPRTLASLLGEDIDLVVLGALLGLRQPEVMKLLRGKVAVSPKQMELIAKRTGLTVDSLAETVRPLPLGLAMAAEHPRWRPTWVQRSRDFRIGEYEARLSGSYGAFALAARETGRREPDWDQRLRQYLQNERDVGGT